MKTSIILATSLLLTTSAFASTTAISQNRSFTTDTYSTKAEAYDAGFDLADSVKAMDQSQLRHELSVENYTNVHKIGVDSSEVTVQGIATNRDDIQYRAIVDLDYHFDAKHNTH